MLGEHIESVAWRGEAAMAKDKAKNVTIYYVDGKLRNIEQDGVIHILSSGEWVPYKGWEVQ